ncbi:hypothetical protein DL765_003982 [Monosporascus sp. GIB2]|nr:hypothetical protein DL765_003982 [Monosporascus sp. GIB2]
MSSMLKKSGGLAFKPKAGRRPGPGPSQASSASAPVSAPTSAPVSEPASAPASAPVSTTGTPAAEPQTQASTHTPTPTPIAPPGPVPQATPPPTSTEQEPPTQIPQSTPQPKPTTGPQPTPESTIPSSTPTVQPAAESASASRDVPGLSQPPDTPTPDTPASNSVPITNNRAIAISAAPTHMRNISSTTSTAGDSGTLLTPEPPAPTTTSAKLPTAPPSPAPAPDTINAAPPGESSTTAPAPKKKRTYKKRSAPSAEAEDGADDSTAPKKKKVTRKRKPPTTENGESAAAEGEEGAIQPKKTSKPRRQTLTPEDAENQQIDHSTTKMGELIKDLGIGKPFKHAEAIAERARQAREAARRRRLEKRKRAMGLIPDNEEDVLSASAAATGNGRRGVSAGIEMAAPGVDTGAGVGYEVVDGQIVVNQSSLVVDRHAGQDSLNLVTVEEDEFSHLTTAASYRRPSRAITNAWTEDETERFYHLLSMFGCDFETIAGMLPGKNRRMVKCKFSREERLRPKRVNAAIMVRGQKKVSIDIEEYKATQRQWQEADDIMEEHARLVEEHRRDIKRLKAERRAAGLADDSTDDDEDNSNNNNNGNNEAETTPNGEQGAQGEATRNGEGSMAMTVETTEAVVAAA